MALALGAAEGMMGYGDDEFMAHLHKCQECKNRTGYISPNSTSYRPHTGNSKCWCCRGMSYTKICQIDVRGWQDLTPVAYV